jgi:hypothetical protein
MSDSIDAWKPWPKCPADDCDETEDVMIMECVPGYTYSVTGGVCGHLVFLQRRPNTEMTDEERRMWDEFFHPADVPRETKEN